MHINLNGINDLYHKMIDDFLDRLHNMGFVVSERSNRQGRRVLNFIDIYKK